MAADIKGAFPMPIQEGLKSVDEAFLGRVLKK